MRRPPASVLTVSLALPLALAACGSSGGGSTAPPAAGSTASSVGGLQQITVHAKDFSFTPSTITVHPGRVRIVLVNDGGGAPHDWQLPDFPADFVPLASNGQTKEATFTAPSPGRYRFVCTIHTRQGMTGTLVVLPR